MWLPHVAVGIQEHLRGSEPHFLLNAMHVPLLNVSLGPSISTCPVLKSVSNGAPTGAASAQWPPRDILWTKLQSFNIDMVSILHFHMHVTHLKMDVFFFEDWYWQIDIQKENRNPLLQKVPRWSTTRRNASVYWSHLAEITSSLGCAAAFMGRLKIQVLEGTTTSAMDHTWGSITSS